MPPRIRCTVRCRRPRRRRLALALALGWRIFRGVAAALRGWGPPRLALRLVLRRRRRGSPRHGDGGAPAGQPPRGPPVQCRCPRGPGGGAGAAGGGRGPQRDQLLREDPAAGDDAGQPAGGRAAAAARRRPQPPRPAHRLPPRARRGPRRLPGHAGGAAPRRGAPRPPRRPRPPPPRRGGGGPPRARGALPATAPGRPPGGGRRALTAETPPTGAGPFPSCRRRGKGDVRVGVKFGVLPPTAQFVSFGHVWLCRFARCPPGSLSRAARISLSRVVSRQRSFYASSHVPLRAL